MNLEDVDKPLKEWSESTVLRYLQLYRNGRIPRAVRLQYLVNGAELIQKLDDISVHQLVKEAIKEALQDPNQAWDQCARISPLDELEFGYYNDVDSTIHDPLLVLSSNVGNESFADETEEAGDTGFPSLLEVPSFTVGFFILLISLGIILCTTLFADNLADSLDENRHDFVIKFFKYASIPIGTTFFTYAHIWLALWSNFYPLEFVGCWQIPGTNIGFPFGWRGIIPFKGEQVARMAVRITKQHLLTVDEIFCRLDPDRLSEVLRPAISKNMGEIIEKIGMEEFPVLWKSIPILIKQGVIKQAAFTSPLAVKEMIQKMRPEIETLFDLENLVVEVLVGDPRLCVDLFIVCGYKEIRFIRNTGALIGGILEVWFLPVVGALAGALTNYLALLLLFWPLYPINICNCLVLHGNFFTSQKELAKPYGKLVHRHVMTVKNIASELLNGRRKERVKEIVRESLYHTIDESLSPLGPFASLIPGSSLERVKRRVCDLVDDYMFEICMSGEEYIDSVLDLENTLESRISKLDYSKFESLLHPIFQSEEWKLVLVGGVVGLIFGMLQVTIIHS